MGDDEATEGFVVFVSGNRRLAVRSSTEELPVGLGKVLIGKALVAVVQVLPIGLSFGIGEFKFGLPGCFAKRSIQFALTRRDGVRVFMQGIVADNRLTVSVRRIELAVARETTAEFVE